MSIKISKHSYNYWTTRNGHDGEYNSQERTTDVTVTIGTLIKVFKGDDYLGKTTEWINKTFAEDQYIKLENEIAESEDTIKKLSRLIIENKRLMSNFLVPVELE